MNDSTVDSVSPEALAALVSHSRFVSLGRHDCRWEISHIPVDGEGLGCIVSDSLTNLLTVWGNLCSTAFTCSLSDSEYQRGFRLGFDRGTLEAKQQALAWAGEARKALIDCDSELSAQGHHRPASAPDELLRLSNQCRDVCRTLPRETP